MILAIETSCDETCAAVVERAEVRSNIVSSQAALHGRFGGVVPEIASRRHLELVGPVVREALADAGASFADLRAIAVTAGPGLIGALLVGVSAAKAYAYAAQKPLIPVDHLHGHVASLFIAPQPLEPPFLCLLASGGHTLLLDVHDHVRWTVLGRSLDDAAGRGLRQGRPPARPRLPGRPGDRAGGRRRRSGGRGAAGGDGGAGGARSLVLGPEDGPAHASARRAARSGRPGRLVPGRDRREPGLPHAAGSWIWAARDVSASSAASPRTRCSARRSSGSASSADIELRCAPLVYCGDNAAMIGAAAEHLQPVPFPEYLQIDAHARANLVAQSV